MEATDSVIVTLFGDDLFDMFSGLLDPELTAVEFAREIILRPQ